MQLLSYTGDKGGQKRALKLLRFLPFLSTLFCALNLFWLITQIHSWFNASLAQSTANTLYDVSSMCLAPFCDRQPSFTPNKRTWTFCLKLHCSLARIHISLHAIPLWELILSYISVLESTFRPAVELDNAGTESVGQANFWCTNIVFNRDFIVDGPYNAL